MYLFHLFGVSPADKKEDCDNDVDQEEEETVDEEGVGVGDVGHAEIDQKIPTSFGDQNFCKYF